MFTDDEEDIPIHVKKDQEMKALALYFFSLAKKSSEYHLLNTDFAKLMLTRVTSAIACANPLAINTSGRIHPQENFTEIKYPKDHNSSWYLIFCRIYWPICRLGGRGPDCSCTSHTEDLNVALIYITYYHDILYMG